MTHEEILDCKFAQIKSKPQFSHAKFKIRQLDIAYCFSKKVLKRHHTRKKKIYTESRNKFLKFKGCKTPDRYCWRICCEPAIWFLYRKVLWLFGDRYSSQVDRFSCILLPEVQDTRDDTIPRREHRKFGERMMRKLSTH